MLKTQTPSPTGDPTPAAIAVARVLCIVGIVYVHAWTGLPGGELPATDHTGQGLLRWTLMELLGRSAVPLLSMISGWLVVRSISRRPWGSFMAGKARTILAPMVLWNALAIFLVSGAAFLGLIRAPMPTDWWWTIDELFCLVTPNDVNVQMSFLRDLFLCMAIAPLLVRLKTPALVAVAMVPLVWAVSGYNFPLLLRPLILFFFIAGMLARRGDLASTVASWPIAVTAIPYAGLALLKLWLQLANLDVAASHPWLFAGLDVLMRFAAALFCWAVAWRLASGRGRALFLRIEPYAFLMFCAHLILIWLGGPLIGQLTGPLGSPFYPLFLLLQPFLALGAAIALGRTLERAAPDLAALLSGGRLAKRRQIVPAGPLTSSPAIP